MKQYCLALDLKDDEALINEYEDWHQNIWPEIVKSIKSSGIEQMEIHRFANRLFMIMQTHDDFSFENKEKTGSENEKVQEWETLMWKYQQAMPGNRPGEKWMLMEKIFDLKEA